MSGGELLELRLLDTRLLDTFGRKSIARHEIDKLLESSKADSNRRGKYCKLLESGFYLIIFHVEHKTNIVFFIKLLEFSTLDKNIFILCRAERCRVFKARPIKRINLLEFVTFNKI